MAIAVPWVIWYSYQIYDVLRGHHYPTWHHVSHAFWSMMIVPVGCPIAVLLGLWVFAGFARSIPGENKIHRDECRQGGSPLEAGRALGEIFVKPDVWRSFDGIDYPVSKAIASYETAFARLAIIKDAVRRWKPDVIAVQVLRGIDQYAGEAFSDYISADARRHYRE
ncbi:MAG: hypothetical protein JOY90_32790, partial [Bradyrhizobium sp.]|uniref:hypothetical protein n=1 Tax=Bradyrhizobium sp. TaxID=376 RepID=UPI001D97A6CD